MGGRGVWGISSLSPPSEGNLILAQEGELHFLRDRSHLEVQRICVGQGATVAHPLPLLSPQWAADDAPGQ